MGCCCGNYTGISMATFTRILSLKSGAYTIPSDFAAGTLLQVECIGAGGPENTGGGAYSKTNGISGLAPGQTVYVNVGSYGNDSWFNKTSNSAPTSTTDGCLAKCGATGPGGGSLGPGGLASAGVGDLKYSGGTGGQLFFTCVNDVTGGGGGAAGPNGNGANGGATTGYGGGGANGGSVGTSSAGGNGRGGTGGGAYSSGGTAGNGTNGGGGGGTDSGIGGGGGPDLVFTDSFTSVQWGPCGGAGGVNNNSGSTKYGGGACRLVDVGTVNSSYGIIVFTYATGSASGLFMFF